MLDKLRAWWTLDEAEEKASADNPLGPLRDDQRRPTGPLLSLAFGWGFLITGLLVGSQLGTGQVLWPDLIQATFIGNLINFAIGALVGLIGYQTACNSGLLYRFVYGRVGAALPVLFISILTIGWQAIVVGAFGYAWAQDFDSTTFYLVALGAGLLFTVTTYFGVRGLEIVATPSVLVLVAVGLYSAWINVEQAGGWSGFMAMSAEAAAREPLNMIQAINLVVGSWIVGAVVMAEYTRFARRPWVAIAIPFIVLMIAQWFLQVVGAMGGIVSGTFDFTTYLLAQGFWIGLIGLIGMSLALWTTGDTNLYLPTIQTSAILRRPKRVMVVICGLLGTVLGLGLYQNFLEWIDLVARLVPPLIGPVIIDYYFVHRRQYDAEHLDHLPVWNPLAFIAYALGAGATWLAPDWIVPALFGLVASMLAYAIGAMEAKAAGLTLGYAAAKPPLDAVRADAAE